MVPIHLLSVQLKFRPPMSEEDQGSYFQKESPIHHSNVMHWSSTQNVRSRMAHKYVLAFSAILLAPSTFNLRLGYSLVVL